MAVNQYHIIHMTNMQLGNKVEAEGFHWMPNEAPPYSARVADKVSGK